MANTALLRPVHFNEGRTVTFFTGGLAHDVWGGSRASALAMKLYSKTWSLRSREIEMETLIFAPIFQ